MSIKRNKARKSKLDLVASRIEGRTLSGHIEMLVIISYLRYLM
ncbi:hypothetical protein SAMN05421593_0334 [Chryseobacterium culicis]|uniref:Uncharacterized protein n=1 Tax=Chryseobacterium culicis TaxID=680127 RepID=A0A1H6GVL3_CHRCI|nr:hypothetical protein SAMN05421593_0334 [Chryseobacterium culicis]